MAYPSAATWRRWLSANHKASTGVWIRFFKKSSGVSTVTYAEALPVALAHGWIDGPLKKYDDHSWIHKFCPRRPRSLWSKRNRDLAEALIKSGKMKPAGLKEVEAAKADGRWDRTYDSPSQMQIPEDFVIALAKNKKACRFFQTLNKTNRYAIAWRLQTAKKPQTREKRMSAIIQMLAEGKAFHPLPKNARTTNPAVSSSLRVASRPAR